MTRELTKNQIEFIVSKYFVTNVYSKSIAEKLITTGKCVVYGESKIWSGGIGNYINISECEDGPDLYLYTFKFDMFFESEHYKVLTQNHLEFLNEQLEEFKLKVYEITELFK